MCLPGSETMSIHAESQMLQVSDAPRKQIESEIVFKSLASFITY